MNFCEAPIVTILVEEENDDNGERGPDQQDHPGSNERLLRNSPFNNKRGASLKKFLVHESLLCDASPVMRAAFQGHFAEAANKSMTIRDLDADMINVFLSWFYSGQRLPEKQLGAEQVWYLNMARLAVVADIFQIEGLGEHVIDSLVTGSFLRPPQWAVIEFVYANTPALSNLRRWLVAWVTERIDFVWFCRETTSLAGVPEYASDVAKAFGRQKARMASEPFFDMNRDDREATMPIAPPRSEMNTVMPSTGGA